MHLREDRRHIQDRDVELVREAIATDVNLEMACTDEMVAFAADLKPAQVCIVPENRQEVTTEGGLDVKAQRDALHAAVGKLRPAGIQVSLFIDPDEEALLAASEVGAEAVELHTGRYAGARSEPERVREFLALRQAGITAHQLGMRVHAGHGLDYRNVWRIAGLPEIEELNIGFAIVARALFVGLTDAVREMRTEIDKARELAETGRG